MTSGKGEGSLCKLGIPLLTRLGRNSQTRGHRADYRTRRDRTRRRTEAFDQQMSALTRAYLDWNLANGGSDGRGFFSQYRDTCGTFGTTVDANAGSIIINVVDVFCKVLRLLIV